MEYLKSKRFLGLLFLIVMIVVGCISMISVSRMAVQWSSFFQKSISADGIELGTGHVSEQNTEETNSQWIVREYEERIGVFDLSGKLQYVVDVYLITLPVADQALLRQGIMVSGIDQLTALMEDYTG